MKIYELKYFSSSKGGLSGACFENKESIININLDYVVSLSDLKKFTLPFSGKFVDNYALLIMSNNYHYYVKEDSYNNIIKELK